MMKAKHFGIICSISLLLTIIPAAGVLGDTPDIPNSPMPTDMSTSVSIYSNLRWTSGDPGPDDAYTYTILFGTTNPPPMIVENQTEAFYEPGTLSSDTTYYWQIIAWNQSGVNAVGPVWQFKTVENQPPFTPWIVKAPLHVGVGFTLNFSAVSADSDGDKLYFQWEWGDGRTTSWQGPYIYGESATCANSWIHSGTYSVRVRAKDSKGAMSAWCNPIIISIAPQIHLVKLEPGFVYFDLWGFDQSFGFLPILQEYGMSAVLSTGGCLVNATVSPSVTRVDFAFEDLLSHDTAIISDTNMSDGCDAQFTLSNGLYKATAFAFDANGNLIDSKTRDMTLFLLIKFNIKDKLKGLFGGHHRG
jgi:hypothetical protein